MKLNSIYKSEKGKKRILNHYKKLINEWNFPHQEHIIETSFGETFALEAGSNNNESVILLHGSSSNSAIWLDDINKYAKEFHVWAIDIPGECGLSSENRFSVNEFHKWLDELLLKLKIENTHLVGNSLGGYIATSFAIKTPSKVSSLNLIASSGFVQMKLKTLLLLIVTSFLGNWGFRQFNKMVYGNEKLDEEILKYAKTIQDNYKPRTDVLPVFKAEDLAKITAPTTFQGGENDCFFNSKKVANRIDTEIENSTTFVIKNKGHVLTNTVSIIIKQARKQ